MENFEYKICEVCKESKMALAFFRRSKRFKDGLCPWCKSCAGPVSRAKLGAYTRSDNSSSWKKKRLPTQEGHKFCSHCGAEKVLDQFRITKRGKPHSYCKPCESARTLVERNFSYSNDTRFREIIKARHTAAMFLRSAIFFRFTNQKSIKIQPMIGCTKEQFLQYIESKWGSGMSWQNYGKGKGKWELDHYFPLTAAYDSGEESFKKACHYENIRPSWWEDNMKKGASVPI